MPPPAVQLRPVARTDADYETLVRIDSQVWWAIVPDMPTSEEFITGTIHYSIVSVLNN
ncbi:MAG: hypothetical protein JNJ61_11635 [Anaerolineae bacterium]|nr:hypothetical protein [Anaerolineae bacterium]